MSPRARCIAAAAALAVALGACGGSGPTTKPTSGLLQSAPATNTGRQQHLKPIPYLISLPSSSNGPTTCTVYEADYATQIVIDSRHLNVRAECEVWAANQPDVGYLWGYEGAVTTPDASPVCTLMDPNHGMTASVIEDTGFVPVSPAQQAKGRSACAAIVASGWTKPHRGRRAGRVAAR